MALVDEDSSSSRGTTIEYGFHPLETSTTKGISGDKPTVIACLKDTKVDITGIQVLPGRGVVAVKEEKHSHNGEALMSIQNAASSATISLVTVIFAVVVIHLRQCYGTFSS